MTTWIVSILLTAASFLLPAAQGSSTAELGPSISISLPSEIQSDTVQISYFLRGSFGGFGSYVKPTSGVHSYEIPTVVDGQAATEIRIIVYATGCEIQQFVHALDGDSHAIEEFVCQRPKMVELSGRLVATELVRNHDSELVVTYMAYWAHEFFGIDDGTVISYQLAAVSTNAEGMFEVELPCFKEDIDNPLSHRRAHFRLVLRDSKTGNPIAGNLLPDNQELRDELQGVRILSKYPDGMLFAGR